MATCAKNYLFGGSHDAAQKAAMMHSFFANRKLNNVAPLEWLTDVLHRNPNHKVNQFKELLPQYWQPAKTNP